MTAETLHQSRRPLGAALRRNLSRAMQLDRGYEGRPGSGWRDESSVDQGVVPVRSDGSVRTVGKCRLVSGS